MLCRPTFGCLFHSRNCYIDVLSLWITHVSYQYTIRFSTKTLSSCKNKTQIYVENKITEKECKHKLHKQGVIHIILHAHVCNCSPISLRVLANFLLILEGLLVFNFLCGLFKLEYKC